MADGFEAYRRRRHFDGLNGLRAVAIAAVIWHHCYFGHVPALGRGFLGVDLFFVLSGFLIMTLLLRERVATGRISLPNFWARRALRLFPPYYLLLGVTAAAALVHPSGDNARGFFATLPTDLVYLSNWVPSRGSGLGILWSLATEQQFYLVWPLVMTLLPRLALPLLGAFLLANQWVNFHLDAPALVRVAGLEIVQATFTPICLGVALAALLHNERTHRRIAPVLAHRAALPALAAAGLLLILFAPADIAGLPRLALQLLAAALIGAVVLRPEARAVRALEWGPIARVGIVSYGMYLYHMLAWHFASPVTRNAVPATFLLTALLTYLLAELSFRWMEQPILSASRRFRAPAVRDAGPLSAGPSL